VTAVFHHLQRLRNGGATPHTSICLHEMHRKSFTLLYVHVAVRGRSVSMLLCAVGVCPTQFIIVEMVSEPAGVVCLPAPSFVRVLF
jgi:hypothetical protein